MFDMIQKLQTIRQLLVDKKFGEAIKLAGQVAEQLGDLITQLVSSGPHTLMAVSPVEHEQLLKCCDDVHNECRELLTAHGEASAIPTGMLDPATVVLIIRSVVDTIRMIAEWRQQHQSNA